MSVDSGSRKPYVLRNRIGVMFYQLSECLNIFILQKCNKSVYRSPANNHYVEVDHRVKYSLLVITTEVATQKKYSLTL